jgi:hypothetical protein
LPHWQRFDQFPNKKTNTTMKKLGIALVASLFLFASCGKKSEEGTHTHDDGTTHTEHSADSTQEEFNAADTMHHSHDSTDHGHSH